MLPTKDLLVRSRTLLDFRREVMPTLRKWEWKHAWSSARNMVNDPALVAWRLDPFAIFGASMSRSQAALSVAFLVLQRRLEAPPVTRVQHRLRTLEQRREEHA